MDDGSPLCAPTPIPYPVSVSPLEYLSDCLAVWCQELVSRRESLTDPGSGQENGLDPVHSGQVFTTAGLGAGPEK